MLHLVALTGFVTGIIISMLPPRGGSSSSGGHEPEQEQDPVVQDPVVQDPVVQDPVDDDNDEDSSDPDDYVQGVYEVLPASGGWDISPSGTGRGFVERRSRASRGG
jgi:hypothetical protein